MFDHLALDIGFGVARVCLDRPEKLNALGIGPGSSRDEILRAMQLADADDAVGAILLCARGRAFCAGGDMTGVAVPETVYDEFAFLRMLDEFYAGLRAIKKPIVGAVNGLCLGAGMGLAAQCDLLVAADDARFGLVEGRIGHPGATELVPIIGAAWAKFLILTGELIDAARAREIGLVLEIVPSGELADRAFDLARRIAAVPREAAVLNKACIVAIDEAMGRGAGRIAGRAHDVATKAAAKLARAPDGRPFEEILRDEGMQGIKAARDAQFTGNWLNKAGGEK